MEDLDEGSSGAGFRRCGGAQGSAFGIGAHQGLASRDHARCRACRCAVTRSTGMQPRHIMLPHFVRCMWAM